MSWQPMDTAPLNPYGEAFGPVVLIWCDADELPWPAYYRPQYSWQHVDTGPAWVIPDQDGPPIHPDNAKAWMPLPAPPERKG